MTERVSILRNIISSGLISIVEFKSSSVIEQLWLLYNYTFSSIWKFSFWRFTKISHRHRLDILSKDIVVGERYDSVKTDANLTEPSKT